MKRLPDGVMPPLMLTRDEELAVAQEANDMLCDTIDAYHAFVAGNRTFAKQYWKRIKSKEGFNVFRTRTGYSPSTSNNSTDTTQVDPQAPVARNSSSASSTSTSSLQLSSRGRRRAPPPLDRKQSTASVASRSHSASTSFPILSNGVVAQALHQAQHQAQHKQFPVVVLSGFIPGTVEDACHGSLADNEATWRLRSAYVNDSHRDCKILATIQRPSEADPFQFLGVKWAWRKLPAFVQQRDMVYAESTGLIQDERGLTGYNLMHSVEVPGVPNLAELGLLRMKLSLCYIVRPHDDKTVEIYCRAFVLPAGDMPANIGALIYADKLLATINVIDCSTMKKLLWLTRQRRKSSQAMEPASRYDLDLATHCQGCSRSLKRFGGLARSAAKCRCCKRVVCGKCSSERRVVLDVSEDGEVTQKTMPFCVQCVLEARALPAVDIALATAVDWDKS